MRAGKKEKRGRRKDGEKERRREGEKERRREGEKERRREGEKESRKEGQKGRREEGKKESSIHDPADDVDENLITRVYMRGYEEPIRSNIWSTSKNTRFWMRILVVEASKDDMIIDEVKASTERYCQKGKTRNWKKKTGVRSSE